MYLLLEYMAMFANHSLNVKVPTSSKQSTETPVGGFCCSHACFIATYRFKDASWRKTSIGQPRREFRGGITLKHIILSLLSQVSQRKKTRSLTFHFIYWLFNRDPHNGLLQSLYSCGFCLVCLKMTVLEKVFCIELMQLLISSV